MNRHDAGTRDGKGGIPPDGGAESRPQQPLAFMGSYALAWSGGSIAYTPFLTLLLPVRFSELAGIRDVYWLALCATIGALAAGISNIAWGAASDRWPSTRGRRRLAWVTAGLIATAFGAFAIAEARDPATLVAAVAGWQIALNLLLAPLSAYAADSIDDSQKGLLGGMLAFAPALAALSVIGVATVPGDLEHQMALIMAIVALALLPLLLRGTAPDFGAQRVARGVPLAPKTGHSLRILWFVRLLVQVAEGLVFLFIFYFLRTVSSGKLSLGEYAWTNAAVQLAAIPVALAIGRVSDRVGRRKPPLMIMLAFVATGLAGMGVMTSWLAVVACYALFLMGSNTFLALHSALTMQQLTDPRHFGRDLGFFNLTNTLPSLISPLIAATVIERFGYHGLLGLLAAMMSIPAAILWRLRIR